MSRIIVKNLPAYLDEARLKQHIGAHRASASITDVLIVRRPDGTSRRFGFVGFKDEEHAQAAQQYFDRTFIDTARIQVNVAKAINDETLQEQRAARRRDRGTDAGQSSQAGKSNAAAGQDGQKKAKASSRAITFDEFMDVMQPRSKRKAWGNGETEDADAKLDPSTFVEQETGKKKRKKNDVEKAKVVEVASQHDTSDGEEGQEEQQDQEEAVPDAAVNDEGLTDMEYMYKRMKRNVGVEKEADAEEKKFEQSDDEADEEGKQANAETESDSAEEETDDEVDEAEAKRQERQRIALEKKAKKDAEDTDAIMASGRLFLRNLPFDATEADLEAYFARFGEVTQSHITLDKTTKQSKGIAFVTFADPAHALSAFRSADGHTFQGRLLHILPAIQKGAVVEPQSLKGKRKQETKASATKDFNWNTLYMSADAVASSVAARLGIDKADILNPQAAHDALAASDRTTNASLSPAVRLALAETSVINETREFLQNEGINVDAFDGQQQDGKGRKARRSDTVILVKNIPYGTTADELRALFARHGTVERTIMPPSGTLAVVEMPIVGEAKVAFKALAYKRMGNSILFLEKAPVGLLSVSAAKGTVDGLPQATAQSNTPPQPSPAAKPVESTSTAEAAEGATLFVKNLNFSTTDERLHAAFKQVAGLLFVRIQKRSVRARDGEGEVKLSMGYGFVGFRSVEAARLAQKTMDKHMLDGHALSVTFARRGHEVAQDGGIGNTGNAAVDANETAPTTKLIVKNLPFQATKKDVRDLFAAHGKIKSVRVPRKGVASAGGTAAGVRGFGFVEFVNRHEALHAYRTLRHSHLLGRHLILEWDLEGNGQASGAGQSVDAQQAAFVERLRRKAAQQVAAGQANPGAHRKGKLRLNEEDIREAAQAERRKAQDDDDEEEEEEE